MGKDTVGFHLDSNSPKQKRKNSSSAPKSAVAAKESEFEDGNGVLPKKTVFLPLIDSPREDELEPEYDEEEERNPSSDEGMQEEKTGKKKLLVEKNDGSDSGFHEKEERSPSSDEGTQKEKTKKKLLVEKNDGSDSGFHEEEERSPSSDERTQKEKTKKKLLVEKNDGSDSEFHEEEERSPSTDEGMQKEKTKKKLLLVEKKDGSDSEFHEEEKRSPSSDEGMQKEKTKKRKLLVEKNDGPDSESHGEEENSEPEQSVEIEKNSKSGEEKGKGSSSDDEDSDENQNKALQKSDESAAEKEEATSEDDDKDGKQRKLLVDSDGSSAVKKNAAGQEAKQRPRTRSSYKISEDTVPKNITPAKRTAETDDGSQPQTRHSKRVARKIEYAQDEAIKRFQRRWSEKDETILLKGIIKYCKAKNVEISTVDTPGLVDFIEDSCHFHFQPNRRQLTDKIWKMKRKYEKNLKRADHSNMVPHEIKIFNLSRQVWGYLNDDRIAIEARKDVEVEIDTAVRDAPQQSEVDEQLKEFRFRQFELCLKKLELMKEETLLNLEISRFSSSVNKNN